MHVLAITRRLEASAAAFVLACLSTGLLFYLLQGSKKPVAAIGGAIGLAIVLFLSGNPRLLSLYGLMIASPFDLSKRFGQYIEKMGGESAFRAELSDVFLVVLFAFLVRDVWTGRNPRLYCPKVAFIWIAIAILGVYSLIAGPFRLTVSHELVRMAKILVMFLVVTNELRTPERILHCGNGLILGVLVQSSVGVMQFIRKKHLGLELLGETGKGTLKQLAAESISSERAFRVGAFMNHPNIFGCFLAILIPLAIALFLRRSGWGSKAFHLAAAGLGMVALIGTMSRSGWLSCAASVTFLAVVMILHEGSRRRSLLAIAAAAAVLLVVCVALSDRIATRLFASKEGAMVSRSEYIDTATAMIERKPIMGWGLNSYVWHAYSFTRQGARAARKQYKQWLPPVHNIYYLWTAELGFVGLFVHLALFLAILRSGLKNFKVRDELLFAINAACVAGLLAIMIDGWFSFTWRINSIMRVFWVIAAIIMAIQRLRARRGSGDAAAHGGFRIVEAVFPRQPVVPR